MQVKTRLDLLSFLQCFVFLYYHRGCIVAGSARSNSSLPTSTITNTKGATPSTSASGSESGGSNEFKSCEIYINCDTRWDDLQIIISRSTATDLPKMVTKLQDFLDQQHRSGIRALHTLQSSTSSSQSGFSRIPNVPEESETSLVDNEPSMFLISF